MSFRTVIRWLASAACAVVLPMAANAAGTQGINKHTITIGILGPFSGPDTMSAPLDYGAVAYLNYINAHGGVYGRKFKVVYADSACNETTGIAAARKLVYSDKVFMIMAQPCSGVALAIKPMLLKAGIPWMGTSAAPQMTTPAAPGMFHATYTGRTMGIQMARFVMSKPGVTKVAIIEHSNVWAHGYCDPAAQYVKSHHGKIVAVTTLEPNASDATPQVLRIKASGAQAVLACLYQPDMIVYLRDMQQYGVHAITDGAVGTDFDQVRKTIRNHSYLDQHFFQPYEFKAPLNSKPLEEFRNIFVKYLPKSDLPENGVPTNFYYFGAPTAIVTVEGFRRAGPNPTTESWEKAIESLKDYNTHLLAGTETFSATNHNGVHHMYTVGLNSSGKEIVYESWNKPLPEQQ